MKRFALVSVQADRIAESKGKNQKTSIKSE